MMTMTNKEMYQKKMDRLNRAIALEESDQLPWVPIFQCFPFFQAGYTMADILYDTDLSKTKDSMLKVLRDFDPDAVFGHAYVNAGCGKILEKADPKTIRWAGMPGNVIDKNSIHQFIEFPVLTEGEFDQFYSDRTGWMLNKGLPRTTGLLSPLEDFHPADMGVFNSHTMFASAVSTPEFRHMIETLWEVNDMNRELAQKNQQLEADMEDAGYPVLARGMAAVPFDAYSDFLRGTLDGLADLYERPEEVRAYCDEQLAFNLEMVKQQGKAMPGAWVFMALHKGMDGFMSDEHYREFYWNDLQKIINAIIDAGLVPYIYTEGKYNSRLECLKEVPKGKVIYHFEEVDMLQAKKVLGDTACISGGFPVYLLDYGTKQQVIDEAKRLIDGCAPGGGFIFETSCGMDFAKRENVEALMDTVRTYGAK